MTMRCFINGTMVQERFFWIKVDMLANSEQKVRVLDGEKVLIAGNTYWIETDFED